MRVEHCLVAETEICLIVVMVKAAYRQRDTAKGIERARAIGTGEMGWMVLVLNTCWRIDEKVAKDFLLNTGEVVERWTWGKDFY